MHRAGWPVLFLLAALACDRGAEEQASRAAPDLPLPPEQQPSPSEPSEPDPWAVSPSGTGQVRIGARLTELAPLLAQGTDTTALEEGCAYVAVPNAPAGLGFMLEDGRLVRIDVDSGATPTREGARIGDVEQRLDSLYAPLRRLSHKYRPGWFYLVALPDAPADTMSRIVFETDGSRVRAYRAGLYPPVEYVERCG